MNKRIILLTALICGAAPLLVACSCDAEKKTEGAGVSAENAPVYEAPTMDALMGKPQAFPAQYPIKPYPNAKVNMVWVTPKLPPGVKNQVLMTTADKPLLVGAYYKQQMVKDGWSLVGTFENIAYSGTTWRKGDQEAEVRVANDPYGTQSLQLMVGPIPKPMVPIVPITGQGPQRQPANPHGPSGIDSQTVLPVIPDDNR